MISSLGTVTAASSTDRIPFLLSARLFCTFFLNPCTSLIQNLDFCIILSFWKETGKLGKGRFDKKYVFYGYGRHFEIIIWLPGKKLGKKYGLSQCLFFRRHRVIVLAGKTETFTVNKMLGTQIVKFYRSKVFQYIHLCIRTPKNSECDHRVLNVWMLVHCFT